MSPFALLLNVLWMIFGGLEMAIGWLFAATAPVAITLAGLAMLRVLQTTFVTAFSQRFSLGALVAFLVTVADVPLLSVGAAFWGLLSGLVFSWLLERKDFMTEQKP